MAHAHQKKCQHPCVMMVECLEANIFYEQLLFFYLELLSLTSVMVNLYLLLLTVFTLYDFIYGQLLIVAFGCIYIRLYLSYHMYISVAPEQEGHIIESGVSPLLFLDRTSSGDDQLHYIHGQLLLHLQLDLGLKQDCKKFC